ncbi:hypothetical protein GIB67_025099 [Kingdonia uniflora]|uniref:Uncharacterized protein n=1 Tax=Kingdonia uniflora TaxID=39325 RepID=A0A7J7N7W4_9MAGN|nr:hypothetical protein GIB67_025099 [Kingdonia uniflora]
MHHDDVFRLNLLKIILSFLLQNKGRNIERNHIKAPAIGDAPAIKPPAVGGPTVSALTIGSSYFSTKIRAVVGKVCSQLEDHVSDNFLPLGDGTLLLGLHQFSTPEKTAKSKQEEEENLIQQVTFGEGLEVVKYLMVHDEVDDEREANLEVILFGYGGGHLKTMVEKIDVVFYNQEEVVGEAYQFVYLLTSTEQRTAISVDEQTMEVAKTKVVFSHQEEDVDKANQTSVDQTTGLSVEEQSK